MDTEVTDDDVELFMDQIDMDHNAKVGLKEYLLYICKSLEKLGIPINYSDIEQMADDWFIYKYFK